LHPQEALDLQLYHPLGRIERCNVLAVAGPQNGNEGRSRCGEALE
jgi:hypothetical protein